jgi:hypothetical protein
MQKVTGSSSLQGYIFRHLFALAATSTLAAFLLFGAVLPLAEVVAGKHVDANSFADLKREATIHALPDAEDGVDKPFSTHHDANATRIRYSYSEIREAFRRHENTEEHIRACTGEPSAWFFANTIAEIQRYGSNHTPSLIATNLRQSRAPPIFAV